MLAMTALMLSPLACGQSTERQDVTRVLAQVERVRQANPNRRLPQVVELERMQVKAKRAQLAQSSCASAYRALYEGNKLADDLKAKVRSGRADAQIAKALTEAEQRLTAAQKDIEVCRTALQQLHRWLRR